jgi:cytochrome b pre-mRNA-processing protein 3
MLNRLFKPRPAKVAGEALYSAAAAQARSPGFYRADGVADTREGRFELYSLHVILLLERLKGHGEQGDETAQALMERYIRGLDDAFRDLGVGDVGVAKKVKKLAEAFYGRAKAFQEAFAALPERTALEDVIARTTLEGGDGNVAGLTDYVLATRDSLSQQTLDALYAGEVTFEARP